LAAAFAAAALTAAAPLGLDDGDRVTLTEGVVERVCDTDLDDERDVDMVFVDDGDPVLDCGGEGVRRAKRRRGGQGYTSRRRVVVAARRLSGTDRRLLLTLVIDIVLVDVLVMETDAVLERVWDTDLDEDREVDIVFVLEGEPVLDCGGGRAYV